MRELLGIISLVALCIVAPYVLILKWPRASVKYDEYYNGYYIVEPGIFGKQVHNYNGDFYTVRGSFDKNYVYTKKVADSLFIEYKRWLKAGH